MADYYPLVAKAVAGLEKNTGEGRRTLYERARTALVAQLRGMNDPPLTEAEITRERPATPARPRTPSRTVTDEGLKGFRDVIAEAEALGDATAQGAKTARETFAATSPSGETFNRVEPRI